MRPLLDLLEDLPFPSVLHSTSSLDIYYDRPEASTVYVYTEADLIELAKCYSALEYPGSEIADAILNAESGAVVFKTVDLVSRPPALPFTPSNLYYDPRDRKYLDPYGVYDDVRHRRLSFADEASAPDSWRLATETAVLISRYEFTVDEVSPTLIAELSKASERLGTDDIDTQRRVLVELIESRNPKAGFELLRRVGYIDTHWPELADMYGVAHTKEHHPEGNLWEHTLETFHYRKDLDIVLSLGLLFHDSGKPFAQRNEGRMFDRHSQIGARIACDFMKRLGFSRETIDDVGFLVREHMLPGFIHELPTFRTEHVLGSQLFPLLLELYRCDLSSTYRGPDGYYRACKVYRAYLKNVRNPFRTPDGKKILNRYVER